jgi:hypothetical protein
MYYYYYHYEEGHFGSTDGGIDKGRRLIGADIRTTKKSRCDLFRSTQETPGPRE